MRTRLIGSGIAAALLATGFSVGAAELVGPPRNVYKAPPPLQSIAPYVNWSGIYLGLNGGYAWGGSRWDALPPLEFNTGGGLFGLTLGYNVHNAGWLFGVEGDYDWTKIKGNIACGFANCETRNNWLSTVRGRLGMPTDRFMPYITGGVAFGDISANNTNLGFGTESATRTGWSAGAGLEFMVTGNLSAKIEYLHVNLGAFNCSSACVVAGTENVSWNANILRGGLNFKFDLGGPAVR